jgi:2-keto-3-deoxy-L-rhamnonate aldolase RhmA
MAATIVRASNFGADWEAYVERIEREVLVICQIESQGAVENVEAIAATEGLDMLFVGPFDLSASLGYLGQPDHREVRGAIDRIEAAAKSAGALLGGISTPGRTSGELLAQGYDLILPDGDVALLRDGARASVRALRSDREAAGRGSDR